MSVILDGTTGITFPAGGTGNPAGAVVGLTDSQTLTNKTLSTGLVMDASAITSGTSKAYNWNALTNNTVLDFTGIPSWIKRITVIFSGLSHNNASAQVYIVQLGTSSGFETTGYAGTGAFTGATAANFTATTGLLVVGSLGQNDAFVGHMIITNVTSNTWVSSFFGGLTGSVYDGLIAGSNKSLSGTLTQIRITTVSGTPAFDAGTVNILYE